MIGCDRKREGHAPIQCARTIDNQRETAVTVSAIELAKVVFMD